MVIWSSTERVVKMYEVEAVTEDRLVFQSSEVLSPLDIVWMFEHLERGKAVDRRVRRA